MHLKKTHTPTCQAEKGYFAHSLQAQSNGIYVPQTVVRCGKETYMKSEHKNTRI